MCKEMLGRHIARHSLGSIVCHTKRFLANADRTMHTASKVYGAVKDVIPPSSIKTAAEKTLSSYQAVRQAIRNNAPLI